MRKIALGLFIVFVLHDALASGEDWRDILTSPKKKYAMPLRDFKVAEDFFGVASFWFMDLYSIPRVEAQELSYKAMHNRSVAELEKIKEIIALYSLQKRLILELESKNEIWKYQIEAGKDVGLMLQIASEEDAVKEYVESRRVLLAKIIKLDPGRANQSTVNTSVPK